MDYKGIASDLILLQSLLSKAGLLNSQPKMAGLSLKLGFWGISIVILLLLGCFMGLAGLYLYLITIYTNYMALMLMAGTLIALAFVLLACRFLFFYSLKKRLKKSAMTLCDDFLNGFNGIQSNFESLADKIDKPVSEHPKFSLAVAFLAGFVLMKKIRNL